MTWTRLSRNFIFQVLDLDSIFFALFLLLHQTLLALVDPILQTTILFLQLLYFILQKLWVFYLLYLIEFQ